jgi:deoxyadenosine/deoxycytidine kinase
MSNKSIIFSIEGNIGSGKSTLVKRIKDELASKNLIMGRQIICVQEPVDDWNTIKDKSGITILEKFYGDQEKYAFPFQMMAYISRLALLKKTVDTYPDAIIITERCTDTDKNVFAQMLYDSGKMEDVNFAIYLKWYETFIRDIPNTGHIYVKTDPTTCEDRIKVRCRDGEEGIPLEYLEKCHDYHENWLMSKKNKLILDGNHDITSDEYNTFITKIKEYIAETIMKTHSNDDFIPMSVINNKTHNKPIRTNSQFNNRIFENHFC